MNGHIYLIRNLLNGKGYVGQTTLTVAKRFATHKSNARFGIDYALYRAMREYGVENFSVLELASCESKELLNDLEKHYIKFCGTFAATGHGYNMTEGGDNAPGTKGWRHSEESRAKIGAARKGQPHSTEHKAKLSAALKGNKINLGRKHSLETKAKMSLTRTGVSTASKGQLWSNARRAAQNLKKFEGAIQ